MDISNSYILLGKFHPLIVHFPIALLLLACIIELWRFLRKNYSLSDHSILLLAFGSLTGILAAIFGWFHAESQGFFGKTQDLLFYHRWLGVSVAVISVFCFLYAFFIKTKIDALRVTRFRYVLFILAILIAFTSHYGALLVHGTDYFSATKKEEKALKILPQLSSKESIVKTTNDFVSAGKNISFSDQIHPILQDRCGNCHLNGKRKGGLRLDSLDLALKGGEEGPALVIGDSNASQMISLVKGKDPDRIMPSKGRRLSEEEINLLSLWIDQGANYEKKELEKEFHKVSALLAKVKVPKSTEKNPIDKILEVYFKKKNIKNLKLTSDEAFLRRVYLDLIGITPSVKERELFLKSKDLNKRSNLINKLLNRKHDFASHWLSFWNDALRNGYSGPGFLHGNRQEITPWLYRSLYNNMPYNDFVKELVNPQVNSSKGFARGILWWKENELSNVTEHRAIQAAQNIGQVFLGINMKCATCHDSFTDAWTLDDTYGIANIYALSPIEKHECNQPLGEYSPPAFPLHDIGEVSSPLTENLTTNIEKLTKFKGLKKRAKVNSLLTKARKERLNSFSNLMVSKRNGRLVRTIVNRFWSKLFGFGLIEPIDELDSPSWNQKLLDWLSNDLIENSYDLKKTLKLILNSKAYQYKADFNENKLAKEDYVFKGPLPKRLSAEQFLDVIYRLMNIKYNFKNQDFERVLKLFLYAQKSGLDKRVLYKGSFKNGESKKIDLNIKGADSLFVLVKSKKKVLTRLDKLRAKHQAIQTVESEEKISLDSESVGEAKLAKLNQTTIVNIDQSPRNQEEEEENLLDFVSLDDFLLSSNKKVYKLNELKYITKIGSDFSYTDSKVKFKPFGGFYLNLAQTKLDNVKFKFKIAPNEEKSRSYEIYIIKNFNLRHVYADLTELQYILGRPKREQVTTFRNTQSSTMQMLELINGQEFQEILNRGAENLNKLKFEEVILKVYRELLGREPKQSEIEVAIKNMNTKDKIAGIADLVWSISMLPEYQYVF